MPEYIHIEESELRRLYVEEELSTVAIAATFNVTKATIRRKLVKAGIERRTGTEAVRLGIATGRLVVRKGEACPWYKGVRMNMGYRMVPDPHKRAKSGLVMEHRLIMEQHLGRLLDPSEHVHHKNGVRDDNRIENLEVLSQSAHMSLHVTERWQDGRMQEAVDRRWAR